MLRRSFTPQNALVRYKSVQRESGENRDRRRRGLFSKDVSHSMSYLGDYYSVALNDISQRTVPQVWRMYGVGIQVYDDSLQYGALEYGGRQSMLRSPYRKHYILHRQP